VDLFGSVGITKMPKDLPGFVKWEDTVIGEIFDNGRVEFSDPTLNTAVSIITGGKSVWSASKFREFLSDRLPSKNRRDIEKILHRCGLFTYDEFSMAAVTRALNAKDLFWLAKSENEKFEDIVREVFSSIFIRKIDLKGDSIVSPEGVNVKRYGVSNGSYGIFKKRLHPYSTDAESEVAVYHLAKLLGVRCCPSWLVDLDKERVCFSKFEYNFAKENIVHVRRIFEKFPRGDNEYENLIGALPQFKEDIQKMIVLDFITRQTDRHLSNMALKVSGDEIEFYSLYDNGRSLFFEDREEFMMAATKDIELYSTEFGPVGTYFDMIQDIRKDTDISKLVDLNIDESHVREAISSANITGDRFEYSVIWVCECLRLLKSY